jgi:hypothetical protein
MYEREQEMEFQPYSNLLSNEQVINPLRSLVYLPIK